MRKRTTRSTTAFHPSIVQKCQIWQQCHTASNPQQIIQAIQRLSKLYLKD